MSKRVLAMALAILAFFIFVGSPFGQSAKAVTLEVSIIAIILAALAAMGITIASTQSFNSAENYMQELLQEYAIDKGVPYNQLFTGLQAGSNNIGQILINNRFVTFIQAFGSWIKAKFQLQNNNVVMPNATYTLSGLSLYSVGSYYLVRDPQTNLEYIMCLAVENGSQVNDVYYFFQYVNDQYNAKLVSRTPYSSVGFQVWYYDTSFNVVYNDGRTVSMTGPNENGLYYGIDNNIWVDHPPEGAVTFIGDYWSLRTWMSTADISVQGDIKIETGVITLPNDDNDYTDGDGAALSLGASWGMTYDDITYRVLPETYEDADITYTGEDAVQEQVSDTPAQSISQEVSDYQVLGLQNVFPFCIPFDIYAFFECLAAEPEAPAFTWRFYIPGICDEEVEIDLAAFDSAARILRTMELLLFIVGLAFVTRDKFLRG